MSLAATKSRVRLRADERRQQIVDAAFEALAERGFEGFRTRDIADRLGINSATLHHHSPTKDDLISAVADELMRRFQTEKAPSPSQPLSAIAAFEHQFADAIHYRTRRPMLLAVYREFVARADRDPQIAALVERLNETWRADIRQMLDQAAREEALRPGIDRETLSRLLLHAIWGLASAPGPADAHHLVEACRQLRSLLFASR
ncbi:MAG TPA: helix-turn-helix domain-containing protein [Stellaceae bacterium]|nr:helix-turn-helix domain-containing protein [Stellaceae bacterium]